MAILVLVIIYAFSDLYQSIYLLLSLSSIIEVTEEPTKPSAVQQELECLNEDIIKNLLDEDHLKPSNSTSSMPTISSGAGSRSVSGEIPTYASSEEDSSFTGTYYNGSML